MAEMSPLRRRMIEDMTVRNLSPATQRSYIHAVAKFSRYFGRSPDRLGVEDVRAFQVHLISTGISWPALNQTVCALRFFYGVTLGHDDIPAAKLALCRKLLAMPAMEPAAAQDKDANPKGADRCPCCGGAMVILGILPCRTPRHPSFRDDSS
jgi:Phage integrase, N-terminal SAM-like domain